MDIILASASDRRKELLKRLTKDFSIEISKFDESSVAFNGNYGEYVMDIAEGKAVNCASKTCMDSIIIGCDTAVFIDDKVLGKPKDEASAFEMLKGLSGRTHTVCSGIAIYNTLSGKLLKDFVSTDVVFSALSDKDIKRYISAGEPMDKAGAYGIQGYGGVFVKEIHGCYYNVVGLPLNKLKTMLGDMGVNL